MQLKFTFILYRYQPFVFHRKPNGWPMNKMKKIKRQGQETQQMLRERFLALLFIGLVSYPFFPEGSSIVGRKTTMSDKSSWDTLRKRRFSIHKHLALFYLHLALNLWYPRPPIQCCVGVVVCVVEEVVVLRKRVGGNVHDLGQDGARTTAHYDNSHELLYTSKDVVFLPLIWRHIWADSGIRTSSIFSPT